mmetsp:Transcript_23034/g.45337  ORF Transcript_23034/g.45337 Transcript_23034/m.45337 type:complete len:100 (+) Transcript_23034:311-610(+)
MHPFVSISPCVFGTFSVFLISIERYQAVLRFFQSVQGIKEMKRKKERKKETRQEWEGREKQMNVDRSVSLCANNLTMASACLLPFFLFFFGFDSEATLA